ncbi:MAG: glycosyltransferase family 4 protein, partial [Bacteroidales bacterium]
RLIEAYNELKKSYDIMLITIGGVPSDPLYRELIEAGGKNLERIPHEEIRWYYSAADVYCLLSTDEVFIHYGGIGTAVIEALASNVPVVSRHLIHFPGINPSLLGEIPENREDVAEKIDRVLNNPDRYRPRESVKAYYDFELILKRNIEIYHSLFREYYSS